MVSSCVIHKPLQSSQSPYLISIIKSKLKVGTFLDHSGFKYRLHYTFNPLFWPLLTPTPIPNSRGFCSHTHTHTHTKPHTHDADDAVYFKVTQLHTGSWSKSQVRRYEYVCRLQYVCVDALVRSVNCGFWY